ncbi:MAG: MarR family transcriptional regulator [Acidisphaera sp.]|nr:MarR family transcriptional regulator [Acidisphaera sp.]MBV9813504.1 MarR family transcriptional regulator [Acetobacteraceae bacterium]
MSRRVFGVDDPHTLAALAAYLKLLRASRSVLVRVERCITARGLTPTQMGVLECLLHHGPLTHRELGRKVLTSAGNITDVVDKLEARTLVERRRDTADRRLVRVSLTAQGRDRIEVVFPDHARDIAEAMGGLDPGELMRLGELLRSLGTTAARGTCRIGE